MRINARRMTGFGAFSGAGVMCLLAISRAHSPSAASVSSPGDVGVAAHDYRNWRLISVAHEEGNLHSFAAVLGNDVAIEAYRNQQIPFPDGAIIASLHYKHVPSVENNKVFGQDQSFVPGPPTNVQFMIKNSVKYAATGGWGFSHYLPDGKTGNEELMKTCFPCHDQAKSSDLVFTHYLP
jgi:hypothetical protein